MVECSFTNEVVVSSNPVAVYEYVILLKYPGKQNVMVKSFMRVLVSLIFIKAKHIKKLK